MFRSSAKRDDFTENVILSQRSFMATRNKVTERVEPCCTPFSWLKVEERWPLILTWKDLFSRKCLTKRSRLPLHKIFCNSSIRRGRPHMVSYAFVMSRATSLKAWLLSKDFDMSFVYHEDCCMCSCVYENRFVEEKDNMFFQPSQTWIDHFFKYFAHCIVIT